MTCVKFLDFLVRGEGGSTNKTGHYDIIEIGVKNPKTTVISM